MGALSEEWRVGLDLVELHLRVEETFGVKIPDQEASRLETVGLLYRSVLSRLGQERSDRCLTARAFHRLRQALVDETGCLRRSVRPGTSLDVVSPRAARRGLWPRLRTRLRLKLPRLHRPSWICWLLAVEIVALAVLCWPSKGSRVFLTLFSYYCCILFATIAGAVILTRPLATAVSRCRTVGDAARAILADNFATISNEVRSVNENEVWTSLLAIIADQLGVSEKDLRAETHFVRDLNAD